MASLGSLVIELAANSARLQSDLGKAVGMAQNAAARFSRAFSGVAALAGAGSLGAVVARSIEMGDALNKAAIKAGTTGKAMSELAYAAKQSDIDLSSLSNAIKKMQVALSEAASGGKSQIQTLAALGLTIKELRALKPEDQFEILADRISKLKDPADRARAATEVFGKAGADLLPMFEKGAEGIRKAREEAQKLGASFSDQMLKRLADADESAKKLKASWEAWGIALSAVVSPLAAIMNLLRGDLSGFAKAPTSDKDGIVNSIRSAIAIKRANWDMNSPEMKRILDDQIAQLEEQLRKIEAGGGRGGPKRLGPLVPGFDIPKITPAAKGQEAEWITRQARMTDALSEWVERKVEAINIAGQMVESLGDETDAMRTLSEIAEQGANQAGESLTQMAEDAARAAENSRAAWSEVFFSALDGGMDSLAKRWKLTLKMMVADAAASGILSMFKGGSFLSSFTSTLSGGLEGIGKLFGGGKAKGGPLSSGKWYIAGEHGPEPIWGGGAGAFAAGYGNSSGARSVGVTYSPVYNIDARGATQELAKLLPGILRAHGEQVKVELIDGLRRHRYMA